MTVRNLTKKQKRHLRELTDIAYERDLSRCLVVIDDRFDAWKNKKISVWDLNQYIHEFHNEIARELFKAYTLNDPIFTVAFGIVQGVISIDDVQQDCREIVMNLSTVLSCNK